MILKLAAPERLRDNRFAKLLLVLPFPYPRSDAIIVKEKTNDR